MKNLMTIFRLGMFSYKILLLISGEPADAADINHFTQGGIQNSNLRITPEQQLEFSLSDEHLAGSDPPTDKNLKVLLRGGETCQFFIM